ncbi:amino acid ABC transporter permease [Paraburkholderia silvatlantica]|uniref:Polar amino acid transport system permease protein n=1 Tax=Paraburkholderia silvatlantica TaxID=321895 RepID=A0ABR6FF92_9BURK|nr:amino acid ABC transporter permease [Paraburkholderia silvatlantica]MBB2926086.1 polar amino acid transport system permease protein [Paraburkholderia silvatlantica]PVY23451.1 amino acid ABC transporter membrane protein (PAAT family) [Paraburkholderia silvatlantica]PXW30490.1 amino acid ABC transporter membrane protein (PAAT family) [Paraburkholderia silvatlantica]
MLTTFFDLFDLHDANSYVPDLLKGALTSIELTFSILALSLPFGLLLAIARIGRARLPRAIASVYIEVIRGTPALLQLFYIYFVLPSFGIRFAPFTAGVIGLSINYSAYLAEVYRAGIEAVPKSQTQAAKALGMSGCQTLRLIVLPQAIRIVVPPLGNYAISLFKDTSLVSIVTVKELMFTGQIISSTNFQYVTIFTLVGALYLAFSWPSALVVHWLERKMGATRTAKGGARPR